MKHATFADLGVSEVVVNGLAKRGISSRSRYRGWSSPTCSPVATCWRSHRRARARRSRSAMPLVERLKLRRAPSALVLAPTRELALQIVDEI